MGKSVSFLSKAQLLELSALDIDGIEQRSPLFNSDCHLIKGGREGFWTAEHGVVLEPMYIYIRCYQDLLTHGPRDDLLDVTVLSPDREILYGSFSITKQTFVVPTIYKDQSERHAARRAYEQKPPA